MGVFVRRVLPALLLALAAGIGARAAAPDLQAALRDKFFSILKPEQQKGLTKSSPIDQLIGKMDLQQRQSAASQLPPLESQFPDPASLSEIGLLYLKLGSFSEASRISETLKTKHPEDSRGPYLEAKAKAESGDMPGALAAAKQAVAIDPSNAEAFTFYKLLRSGGTQSSQIPLQQSRVAVSATKDPGGNPTMDERYLRRVNGALAMLRRSTHGKHILLAIVPDSDGTVTEADLREHGVQLVMKQEPLKGRAFGDVERKVEKGQQIFIVAFNSAVLDERNDTREVSAFMGGKLDQVGVQKESAEEIPPILLDWRERVSRAYILIDLGVEAFATAASSDFSQELRLDERIVRGNFAMTPRATTQGETYGTFGNMLLEDIATTALSLKKGMSDLMLILTTKKAGTMNGQLDANAAAMKPDFQSRLNSDYPGSK